MGLNYHNFSVKRQHFDNKIRKSLVDAHTTFFNDRQIIYFGLQLGAKEEFCFPFCFDFIYYGVGSCYLCIGTFLSIRLFSAPQGSRCVAWNRTDIHFCKRHVSQSDCTDAVSVPTASPFCRHMIALIDDEVWLKLQPLDQMMICWSSVGRDVENQTRQCGANQTVEWTLGPATVQRGQFRRMRNIVRSHDLCIRALI